MIFFFNANGDLLKSVVENVYQGSNGANQIYVVAPFPNTNEVSVKYQLPNGEITGVTRLTKTDQPLMQAQTELGKDYNIWIGSISKIATALAGTVTAQFDIVSTQQVVSTMSVTFPVIKGVAPAKPIDNSTEGTIQEIFAILSNLNELEIELNNKVDKDGEKGLSTNDFTNEDKAKVDLIEINGDGTSYLSNDGTYKKVQGASVELDTTLTQEGKAADAKAVGDKLEGKLDKVTGADATSTYRFYAVDNEGNQIILSSKWDSFLSGNVLVRGPNGQILGPTPQAPAALTPKSYVDNKFNGANKAVSFVNYSLMIASLNSLGNTAYSVGQNVMIVTLEVPDVWVSEVAEESVAYTYVSDTDFVNELTTNGFVQVGYYKLSALETQKVDLTEYAKIEQLDGKLDKVTTTNNYRYAYYYDKEGQKTVRILIGSSNLPTNDSSFVIPAYLSNTAMPNAVLNDDRVVLATGTPKHPCHAANKEYVDEAIAGKLDIITDTSSGKRVYIVNSDGTQGTAFLAFNPSPNNIPLYTLQKNLLTGEPVNDNSCTPKSYVDIAVKLYKRHVTVQSDFGMKFTSFIAYSKTNDTIDFSIASKEDIVNHLNKYYRNSMCSEQDVSNYSNSIYLVDGGFRLVQMEGPPNEETGEPTIDGYYIGFSIGLGEIALMIDTSFRVTAETIEEIQ